MNLHHPPPPEADHHARRTRAARAKIVKFKPECADVACKEDCEPRTGASGVDHSNSNSIDVDKNEATYKGNSEIDNGESVEESKAIRRYQEHLVKCVGKKDMDYAACHEEALRVSQGKDEDVESNASFDSDDSDDDARSFDSRDSETWTSERFIANVKGSLRWREGIDDSDERSEPTSRDRWTRGVEKVMKIREEVDQELGPEEKRTLAERIVIENKAR